MGRIDGKVALITGAARGQGRSHAVRLAEEGADIIALDICDQMSTVKYQMARPEDLAETERQVNDLDRRIIARQADVRDQASLNAAVEAGIAEFGRLDIVSANAGIQSMGFSWELTEEQWIETIEVNLNGVWRTVKATVPKMIELGNGGSIIITGSTASIKGFAGVPHYTASKHGVVGFMRALVNEVSRYGIRVNTVVPSTTSTDMIHNEGMRELFGLAKDASREELAEVFKTIHTLDVPWAEPVDISNAVLFLASEEARYVTGAILPVDAGFITKVG
jgi:SDR family mycofactocin-dependent oxidoreductase